MLGPNMNWERSVWRTALWKGIRARGWEAGVVGVSRISVSQ